MGKNKKLNKRGRKNQGVYAYELWVGNMLIKVYYTPHHARIALHALQAALRNGVIEKGSYIFINKRLRSML